MIKKIIAIALAISIVYPQVNLDKFKQLNEDITTPNTYRTAAGYPGHDYWQQEVDYKITAVLDDENQILYGEETITFHNNSPDQLSYLWVQLDQNMRAADSKTPDIQSSSIPNSTSDVEKMEDFRSLNQIERKLFDYDGGFKIEEVKATNGEDLSYAINKTMLRIDLKQALKTNGSISFNIKWWYNINDHISVGGRSGYEYFEEDDNGIEAWARNFSKNVCLQRHRRMAK